MTIDRDELERRILALVRDYLDGADEHYADGYRIGDFMVIFELFARADENRPLAPWASGDRAEWDSPVVAFTSTTSQYWLDEAWLTEALTRVRDRRREIGDLYTQGSADTGGDEDEDEDE